MRSRPDKPRVRLGTGVCIVSPDGRLLIVQQERDGIVDWGPVGGALEDGESIEECARREAYEETGLRVRLLSVDEFWHGGRFDGVGFVFLATPDPWPQAVMLPAVDGRTRFLDHRWVTKAEASGFAGPNVWEFWISHWPPDVRETLLRRHELP